MTPNSLKSAWKSLHLLDDWLATGFSREHPGLCVTHVPAAPPRVPAAPVAPAAPAAAAAAAPVTDRTAALSSVEAQVAACTRCGLSLNRTKAVPGEGPLNPLVLFIGEGPGAEEDASGRPFVGAAGQYLDSWLKGTKIERGRCFIANCVKCRPPQNREPHPEELAACLPYLEAQIAATKPRIICCLGRIAAHTLLSTQASLGELRGKRHQYKGIPVVVTYHPSAVLRDKATLRPPVWEDLKLLKSMLDG